MTEKDSALFNDSLERCMGRSGFLDCFYDHFLASAAEVAEKLKHTNSHKQKGGLKVSLYMMMLAAGGKAEAYAHLERIATRHSRNGLDIRPELYDLWLDCMVQAVKEFDPLFTSETERVWRSMLKPGVEFMRLKY
jgi:hemoglobin-like flavoprotein